MSDIGQKIIARVRFHAGELPDFVYHSPASDGGCVYVHGGCPSCIVGRALWDTEVIGAAIEFDEEIIKDTIGQANPNGLSIGTLVKRLNLTDLDEDEVRWLTIVQQLQDGMSPWGEAVAEADAEVKL